VAAGEVGSARPQAEAVAPAEEWGIHCSTGSVSDPPSAVGAEAEAGTERVPSAARQLRAEAPTAGSPALDSPSGARRPGGAGAAAEAERTVRIVVELLAGVTTAGSREPLAAMAVAVRRSAMAT